MDLLNTVWDAVNRFAQWMFADASATAAMVSALAALVLVREALKIRKMESEPQIAAYLDLHPPSLMSIDLVLRNIGKGPAYNVTFAVSPDRTLFGRYRLTSFRLIADGVRYMAPGQEFRVLIGSYLELPKEPFDLTVTYKPKSFSTLKFLHQAKYSETFLLNVIQFEGLLVAGDNPLTASEKHLKKIADAVDRLKDGRGRLSVHVSGVHWIAPPEKTTEGLIRPTLFNRLYYWFERRFLWN